MGGAMTLRFTSPHAAMESSSTRCISCTRGFTFPFRMPWNWKVCRVVSLAIDFAPYEDHRYLRAATALLEQGRRGAALAVVARARAALAELGLPPPLDLVRIERMGAV